MRVNKDLIDKCIIPELKTSLENLHALNQYYSLLNGGIDSYVKVFETVGRVPAQLKEWLKIFDGGFLFSVSMLSTKPHVDGQGSFLTFSEVNSEEYKKDNGIPSNVVCFAMSNYGSFYFFDSESSDEKIYEWDIEESVAVDEWDSFADWLNTQVDNAKCDIVAGLLDPMED